MFHPLLRLTVIPAAVLAVAASIALTLPAPVVAGSETAALERQIYNSVVESLSSLQDRTTCSEGQCLSYNKRREPKAIAGCFDVTSYGSVMLRTGGSSWGWLQLGAMPERMERFNALAGHQMERLNTLDKAKEKAIFYCNRNRARENHDCECILTSVNDDSVFEVSKSLLEKAEAERRPQQAEAERKAAEAERRAAEERSRREAEAQRAAEEQARKLAENQAGEQQVTAASLDQTRKELEAIRRQLVQLKEAARTTPQPSTARAPAANRPNIQGRNYALIIGNNDYANLPDLETAIGDAAALSELLKLRYSFAPGDVKLLLNANRSKIMDEFAGFRQRLQYDDRLLIYYAGHGQIDPMTKAGFWQPTDAVPGKEYTWIANDDIRRQLRGLPAKHVLVVADSCFSGSLTRSTASYENIPKDRFFTEIDSHVSRKVISSGGTEPVADAGSGGHSVFAYYLLKALRENQRPYLASFELFNMLARAVTNNSNQKPGYGTVADAGDEGAGDFTFILR